MLPICRSRYSPSIQQSCRLIGTDDPSSIIVSNNPEHRRPCFVRISKLVHKVRISCLRSQLRRFLGPRIRQHLVCSCCIGARATVADRSAEEIRQRRERRAERRQRQRLTNLQRAVKTHAVRISKEDVLELWPSPMVSRVASMSGVPAGTVGIGRANFIQMKSHQVNGFRFTNKVLKPWSSMHRFMLGQRLRQSRLGYARRLATSSTRSKYAN